MVLHIKTQTIAAEAWCQAQRQMSCGEEGASSGEGEQQREQSKQSKGEEKQQTSYLGRRVIVYSCLTRGWGLAWHFEPSSCLKLRKLDSLCSTAGSGRGRGKFEQQGQRQV